MTGKELAAACGFTLACGTGEREIEGGIYCCDLLSIVMGRAPADGLWVTVMGNHRRGGAHRFRLHPSGGGDGPG